MSNFFGGNFYRMLILIHEETNFLSAFYFQVEQNRID